MIQVCAASRYRDTELFQKRQAIPLQCQIRPTISIVPSLEETLRLNVIKASNCKEDHGGAGTLKQCPIIFLDLLFEVWAKPLTYQISPGSNDHGFRLIGFVYKDWFNIRYFLMRIRDVHHCKLNITDQQMR